MDATLCVKGALWGVHHSSLRAWEGTGKVRGWPKTHTQPTLSLEIFNQGKSPPRESECLCSDPSSLFPVGSYPSKAKFRAPEGGSRSRQSSEPCSFIQGTKTASRTLEYTQSGLSSEHPGSPLYPLQLQGNFRHSKPQPRKKSCVPQAHRVSQLHTAEWEQRAAGKTN